MEAALKHYESQQRANKTYYTNHRDQINEKRRQKYKEKKEANPTGKKMGRPRKVVEEGVVEVV